MKSTERPTEETTAEITEALMARSQQEANRSRKIWGVALVVAAGALGCLKAADVGKDAMSSDDKPAVTGGCKGVVDCIDNNIEKGPDGVLRVVKGAEIFSPED